MDDMQAIINSVKEAIKPKKSEEEAMKKVIAEIIEVTRQILGPLGLDHTISGSFIRNTWLTDKKEFDLFILFPIEYTKGELEKVGLDIGKRIMKSVGGTYEIAYAEHPYTKGEYKGFSVDIVPCYKVKSTKNIKSAVDRTPFHNKYMKKHITRSLSDEVRLLKKFTKSIGVYGSDIKTMGFSGYLCEILIIHYRKFEKLVKSASTWKPPVFIDIEKHCSIADIKTTFKNQPLVAIDPTDAKRNVAAALSPENFMLFVKACEDFVKKPSYDMFFQEKIGISSTKVISLMKKRGTKFIGIHIKRPDAVDDILWSQVRRTARRITGLLKENEFSVIGTVEYADEDDVMILFEMEVWKLPTIRKVSGPPVFNIKHSKQFLSKYRIIGRVYVEGNLWVAEVKRTFEEPEQMFKHFFRKKPHELLEMGFASRLAEMINTYSILDEKEIEGYLKDKKAFRRAVYHHLTKRFA
ncbi:MAG: CCA tRNA nucleotidyltransferase [Candidatus Micrarchaeota archaeon]|nr:CCA tRNA nucleotidyltransferase [Candidatus Micrarchaeota archaeon]